METGSEQRTLCKKRCSGPGSIPRRSRSGRGGPGGRWRLACSRSLAVDGLRDRRARSKEVGEGALDLVPVPDEADRVLESWAVADALATLRPEHRRVLLETYYLGRSVAEAAVVLGIPAGTVKSRAVYALRALKLALGERGLAP